MYYDLPAQWLLIFFAYCFLGWCFESTVVSLQEHRFVNRGFLRGPLLPIYGCGAVLILWVTLPLQHNLPAVFFAGMAAATLLEYGTSLGMEALFQVKYWDYSTHRLQFQGRICLQSSVAWGVLSVLLTELLHPWLERVLRLMPSRVGGVTAVLLAMLFAADLGYSLRTALDFASMLRELTRLRAQAADLRQQLAAAAEETRGKLDESAAEMRDKLGEAAARTQELLEETMEGTRVLLNHAASEAYGKLQEGMQQKLAPLQASLDKNREIYEALLQRLNWAQRQLLRGNPGAVSAKFGEVLRELKSRMNRPK